MRDEDMEEVSIQLEIVIFLTVIYFITARDSKKKLSPLPFTFLSHLISIPSAPPREPVVVVVLACLSKLLSSLALCIDNHATT